MRDGDFRVRGKDISRVEGLSDAVFGFAITLLAISLEVPKTAHEVLHALRGVLPFAVCFLILFNLWRMQFTFFRRYGIEDTKIVMLTAALLFVLLIFIYPLKFMMTVLSESLYKHLGFPDPTFHRTEVMPDVEGQYLLIAFGLGFAAVFGVFSAMYRHAYALREKLQLDEIEIFDTREFIAVTTKLIFVGLAIAASYVVGSIAPRYADQFAILGSVAMFAVFALVIRQRRTRRRRREAVQARVVAAVEA